MPKIIKIHDNIVTIKGKHNYKQDEYFKLSSEAKGITLLAKNDEANLLVVGNPSSIKNGSTVSPMKKGLEKIDVYEEQFGKIITPFGKILHPLIDKTERTRIGIGELDSKPPALLDRVRLSDPLETGVLAIDVLIPIGKGQRELIIGDRTTGKTTIALNTIINQKRKNVKTIYVAIGQKRTSITSTYNLLNESGVMDDTIIIFANPDSSAQQYIAPKVGMAMAEALAYQGQDVLIIFDDLSKHANIYREISLSIGRNPGREAYPTDIFYQHSRLLERAGRFGKKYKNGSITALPIIETVQGDLASLIPSNVISITDGQIFTNTDMFNKGEFPAIDIGLSVSRTGSAVQNKVVKEAAEGLKARYSELFDIKKFSEMSVDLSDEMKHKTDEWRAITNILLQYGHQGYSNEQITILIQLYKMGILSKLKDRRKFSVAFIKYCQSDPAAKKLIKEVATSKYKDKPEKFQKALKAVFVPLVRISSGIHTDIIVQKEFDKLKGVK